MTWRKDMENAPCEPNEYTGHGPYILIKTEELGWERGTRCEKIRTCYWDPEAEWWQIDTCGEHQFCGLQAANIIGWKPIADESVEP